MKPSKSARKMEKQFVDVIYDRRKLAAKRGKGYVEVRVYLGRNERKYFPMGMASPDEWETLAASEEVTQLLRKCKKIVTAMDVLDEEMTMDNFNLHFYGEEGMQKKEEEKTKEPDNSKKSFLTLWNWLSILKNCAKVHASTRYVLSKPCAHSGSSTPMAT